MNISHLHTHVCVYIYIYITPFFPALHKISWSGDQTAEVCLGAQPIEQLSYALLSYALLLVHETERLNCAALFGRQAGGAEMLQGKL